MAAIFATATGKIESLNDGNEVRLSTVRTIQQEENCGSNHSNERVDHPNKTSSGWLKYYFYAV